MAPARKPRTAATSKATGSNRTKQTPARSALAETTRNIQDSSTRGRGVKRPASDDSTILDSQDAEVKPKAGRGRPRLNKAPKIAEAEVEDELSQLDLETAAPEPLRKRHKPKMEAVAEIPETQQPELEIPETQRPDMIDMMIEEDEQLEELSMYHRQPASSVQRHNSRLLFSASRGPISASDSELHEPTLRRRIGDLTRKHEALEARYRDLREIGVQEAERNFDRLKKQTEERANTDKQLIATLRAQLAGETEIAKDAEKFRRQFDESQRKIAELEGKLETAQNSLTEAKTEIKTLSTKLAAARSSESNNVKVPGSAMKNNLLNNRQAASAAEAAAQLAHKKENLYGDLTGLLVCGVKRENDEEVFDCVQTGRNGTLHFKLSIAMDGSDKFEEAQFMYMPQLDAARDEELIETLPDYLVEEITFPRLHAAKFYSRVVKALTERLD